MKKRKLRLRLPKQSMRRKLFLYMLGMAAILLVLLATFLILLGRFRTPKMSSLKKAICRRRFLKRRY